MKNLIFSNLIVLFLACWTLSSTAQDSFCNPLNLNYRYQLKNPSRREAADPVVVLFRDNYYLFASKSGGYWLSAINDLSIP